MNEYECMMYEWERPSLQKTVERLFLLKGKQFWVYAGYNEKMLKEFYIETLNTPMFSKMSFLWLLNTGQKWKVENKEAGVVAAQMKVGTVWPNRCSEEK